MANPPSRRPAETEAQDGSEPGHEEAPDLHPGADPIRVVNQNQWTIPLEVYQPPDWWRCRRVGAVSGTYEGDMSAPSQGAEVLVLRVDIDPRSQHSPVMDRISGDFYTQHSFNFGGRTYRWRTYTSSWIVDNPTVTWSQCQVRITGRVRFWKGKHLTTNITVVIPWSTFSAAGPAQVTFSTWGTANRVYSCPRTSDAFRDLQLEVDVCASVNSAPLLPTYNTHAHNTRPAGLVQRNMTVASAYDEAGVRVTVTPPNVIDDSASQFSAWSDAELHDAMETHFSQYASGGAWPKWHMWGVLCGRHDSSSLAGIMFDYGAAYGGPGRAPERQGFALFRNHSWFNSLPSGAPANQTQAQALRQYLYTWVHEAGHAFNFVHSWNKSRPNALSWMNYPQYVTNFWSDFMLRFDDEELIHLRHGDRASVIPGGDAWATGFHLHGDESGTGMSPVEGEMPLELMVRSPDYFDFMEPVEVELRLRNLTSFPIDVATILQPEYGTVSVHIRHPSGEIREYEPLHCKLAPMQMTALQPLGGEAGRDRISQTVSLVFGKEGFPFAEPGEYQVRASYHGAAGLTIHSSVHRFRVGRPVTVEQDRFAASAFDPRVGLALYLDGSASPHLSSAMDTLREMADRFKGSMAGVHAALAVGHGEARRHFRFEDAANPVLKESHAPDPEAALKATAPALALLRGSKEKSANLLHHQLVRDRANALASMGKVTEARKELTDLKKVLGSRGVNQPVLELVDAFGKELKKG
jgi:hypothetical protein